MEPALAHGRSVQTALVNCNDLLVCNTKLKVYKSYYTRNSLWDFEGDSLLLGVNGRIF